MDATILSNDTDNKTQDTVHFIRPYWRDEIREEEVARLLEFKGEENANKKAEWRTLINFNDKYNEYRQEFVSILEKYETMREGHIARITISKHLIDLVDENVQPFHAPLYKLRPKRRHF